MTKILLFVERVYLKINCLIENKIMSNKIRQNKLKRKGVVYTLIVLSIKGNKGFKRYKINHINKSYHFLLIEGSGSQTSSLGHSAIACLPANASYYAPPTVHKKFLCSLQRNFLIKNVNSLYFILLPLTLVPSLIKNFFI